MQHINFGEALKALNKLNGIKIHEIVDLAFPRHSEARKLQLEDLQREKGSYFEFFSCLEGHDQEAFNSFLNQLIDADIKMLLESIKPQEITNDELKRTTRLEAIDMGGNIQVYDENGQHIITLNPDLDKDIQKVFATAICAAWNNTFAAMITPDGVSDLKLAVGKPVKWDRIRPEGKPDIHYLCAGTTDTIFYFHPSTDYEDRHFIDLNAYSENLKEKIANNYGYTLDAPRRGKVNIHAQFGAKANFRLALFMYMFFQSRSQKGAFIGTSADTPTAVNTYGSILIEHE
ncbi:hypothetical protein [Chitinophaga sp. Cy-1792]|uniref:hypothetical protein n=1 Tax=Chitinophaga sp. Cy-1792 TaxID=2608339 RepID=UPI0014225139|nr:hypothetical protein [Chitinophaga sp. Cy-1792]NIG56179.1 hypothetical protein [Chitinophaga sp. Cy-1792]